MEGREKDEADEDDMGRAFCRNLIPHGHPDAAPSQKHNIVS